MDKKFNIFDYLAQVFSIFGITVLLLNIFCLLFGESAKGFSTIFSFGNSGLSVTTMLQFLLAISIIIFFRFLFMTDYIIKKLSLALRIVFLFVAAFSNILIFIILCGWFPAHSPIAWIMFFVCFSLSCAVSTIISYLKEKSENNKLAEALSKRKEKVNEKYH